MTNSLPLRPHHGLCLHFFEGKGYSPAFTANMDKVQKQLNANPFTTVKLQSQTDVLCSSCPHNSQEMCESGQKVKSFDAQVLQLCSLQEGALISWGDFTTLVQQNILSAGKLQEVCVNCQWLYICKNK
ncbi:MAG: DUF1284 domain-containing protein [Oscillospiraceae bacterium]|nr:DUF1284 domain-containing protein [Oscillospiraceae bacterium]